MGPGIPGPGRGYDSDEMTTAGTRRHVLSAGADLAGDSPRGSTGRDGEPRVSPSLASPRAAEARLLAQLPAAPPALAQQRTQLSVPARPMGSGAGAYLPSPPPRSHAAPRSSQLSRGPAPSRASPSSAQVVPAHSDPERRG